MKKIVFLFLAALSTCLGWAQSSSSSQTFYVYRNDGNFNAFFSTDVDSITYSTLDVDSIDHSYYTTQEVWTADSVYRTPLSVIDSVSFVAPPTLYKDKVVKLTDEYLSYIQSVDAMNITFSEQTPSYLRPVKGEILLYEGFSDLFPQGFAGRVASVDATNGYTASCDSVSLSDLYEQLLLFNEYDLEQNTNSSSAPSYLLSLSKASKISQKAEIGKTFSFNLGLSSGGCALTGSYTGALRVRATIRISPKAPAYIDLGCITSHKFTAGLSITGEQSFFLNKDRQLKLCQISIPIPECPILRFEYDCAPFLKGEVKGEVNSQIEYSAVTTDGIIYSNGVITRYDTRSKGSAPFPVTTKMNISGYLFGGVNNSFSFGSVGNIIGVELNTYVGPKIEGKAEFDLASAATGDLYNTLKDAQIKFSAYAEVEIGAKLHLSPSLLFSKYFSKEGGVELFKSYLLPSFTEPSYTAGAKVSTAVLSTTVSRDLLSPCQVGMRLYDEQNKIVATQYNSNSYQKAKDFVSPYSEMFENLKGESKYHACPVVKLFGYELRATPETDFSTNVVITTTSATSTTSGATCVGYVEGTSGATTCSYGICYGKNVDLSVSNASCVQAGTSGEGDFNVLLTGLTSKTTYYYCAYLAMDGKYYYGDIKSFTTKDDELTSGEAVDLGLSVKWASHNVGASSPEGYGNYYAWGEVGTKSDYSESTSKWCRGSYSSLQSQGVIDSNRNLTATCDAATQNWGGSWRMPTMSEMDELIKKCTWTWTTYNGVNGRKVVGPNGNSIFLPAAGYRLNSGLYNAGSNGRFWSSTAHGSGYYLGDNYYYIYYNSYGLYVGSGNYYLFYDGRCLGFTVRPVSE